MLQMQARLCDAALVSLMSLFGFMIDLRGEWLLLRQREGSAVSVLYSLRFFFAVGSGGEFCKSGRTLFRDSESELSGWSEGLLLR